MDVKENCENLTVITVSYRGLTANHNPKESKCSDPSLFFLNTCTGDVFVYSSITKKYSLVETKKCFYFYSTNCKQFYYVKNNYVSLYTTGCQQILDYSTADVYVLHKCKWYKRYEFVIPVSPHVYLNREHIVTNIQPTMGITKVFNFTGQVETYKIPVPLEYETLLVSFTLLAGGGAGGGGSVNFGGGGGGGSGYSIFSFDIPKINEIKYYIGKEGLYDAKNNIALPGEDSYIYINDVLQYTSYAGQAGLNGDSVIGGRGGYGGSTNPFNILTQGKDGQNGDNTRGGGGGGSIYNGVGAGAVGNTNGNNGGHHGCGGGGGGPGGLTLGGNGRIGVLILKW